MKQSTNQTKFIGGVFMLLKTIKGLKTVQDIEALDVDDVKKNEIFYTTLYMFYRKIGVNMVKAQIMAKVVEENAKDSSDENIPFIKRVDVRKNMNKWLIKGEVYYSQIKKNKEPLAIFKELGLKEV